MTLARAVAPARSLPEGLRPWARWLLAGPCAFAAFFFVQVVVVALSFALRWLPPAPLSFRILGSAAGPGLAVLAGTWIAPRARLLLALVLMSVAVVVNALLAADFVPDGASTSDYVEMAIDVFAGIAGGLAALMMVDETRG